MNSGFKLADLEDDWEDAGIGESRHQWFKFRLGLRERSESAVRPPGLGPGA
jgi:hypothetical protein